MAATLTHRGPEDSGIYRDGGFGIAHTRLSIIDLPGGHQPIFDDQRRYAIVCNGEIYNFVELRAELEALGCRFSCNSDSEVALHAYAVWGREGFKRLHGMFAFALFDHQTRELWLVRDRLGIKPLYVLRAADQLLFGSEIKALLAALEQTPALHEPALGQFFQNQYSTGRETLFRGIERVAPGEAVCVSADLKLSRWRYWSALEVRAERWGEAEALERWEALFQQVMREHLRSDVPFGVFLSGGVDSAILLAQLSRLQPQPIKSYSIGWKDSQMADELEDAEAMARRFGSEHTSIRLDAQAVFQRLPRSVWAADDLMRDYACLPTLALAEAAGRELKVVFSGEGGDESFAGYGRYRPDAFERQFKRLLHPGSGGFRVRPELSPAWVARLFKPRLHAALAAYRQPVIAAWAETPDHWSDLQRRQYVDLTTNLPDDLLVKADRMLMAFHLEGRVPFLDHRVVAFGLSLADGLKVGEGAGKRLLRRWAQGFLPREHLSKRKRGFYVPVREWLNGPFLSGLAERLSASQAIVEWCEPGAVRALCRRQAEKADVSREVWSLMQFAIWHRLFIEGGRPVPGAQEDPLAWL